VKLHLLSSEVVLSQDELKIAAREYVRSHSQLFVDCDAFVELSASDEYDIEARVAVVLDVLFPGIMVIP
jgi:hypothetical protein